MQATSRSALSRIGVTRSMMVPTRGGASRYLSDGRVLSEEERAAENVYIKKMEREKLEKQKAKEEKERAAKEKENAADKKK